MLYRLGNWDMSSVLFDTKTNQVIIKLTRFVDNNLTYKDMLSKFIQDKLIKKVWKCLYRCNRHGNVLRDSLAAYRQLFAVGTPGYLTIRDIPPIDIDTYIKCITVAVVFAIVTRQRSFIYDMLHAYKIHDKDILDMYEQYKTNYHNTLKFHLQGNLHLIEEASDIIHILLKRYRSKYSRIVDWYEFMSIKNSSNVIVFRRGEYKSIYCSRSLESLIFDEDQDFVSADVHYLLSQTVPTEDFLWSIKNNINVFAKDAIEFVCEKCQQKYNSPDKECYNLKSEWLSCSHYKYNPEMRILKVTVSLRKDIYSLKNKLLEEFQ